MVAFGDSRGIILARFMLKGRTVTARHYSKVIWKNNFKEKLKNVHSSLALSPFHDCKFMNAPT